MGFPSSCLSAIFCPYLMLVWMMVWWHLTQSLSRLVRPRRLPGLVDTVKCGAGHLLALLRQKLWKRRGVAWRYVIRHALQYPKFRKVWWTGGRKLHTGLHCINLLSREESEVTGKGDWDIVGIMYFHLRQFTDEMIAKPLPILFMYTHSPLPLQIIHPQLFFPFTLHIYSE